MTQLRLNGNKRPTMKDVALQAGVSVSTVSHVVNNSRFVEPHTRSKIERAISELGFRPNVIAQSLRGKRSNLLGIIVPNIREHFFTESVKMIESQAAQQGFSVILCDSEDSLANELRYLDTLIQKGVDAIIFCPTSDDPRHYQDLNLEHHVVIQLDRKIANLKLDFVGLDNDKITNLAVKHLYQNGSRYMAFIGYKVNIGPVVTINSPMATMADIFTSAVKDLPKKVTSQLLMLEYKYAPFEKMSKARISQLVKWLCEHQEVDGIICGNQTVCYEVLLALSELGLKIPQDLLLVSLGDNQWLPLLSTPVTAFQQPIEKLATTTLKLVKDRLEEDDSRKPAQEKLFGGELLERGSSRTKDRK